MDSSGNSRAGVAEPGVSGGVIIDPLGDGALLDELFVECRKAGRDADFVDLGQLPPPVEPERDGPPA